MCSDNELIFSKNKTKTIHLLDNFFPIPIASTKQTVFCQTKNKLKF